MTTPCPKCSQVHDPTKCTGHNARGLPCGNRPIRGGRVCSTHGGSAPQVKAAAEQRELEANADAEVRKLWVGLDQAQPVKDPIASLERLAGALESAVDVVGSKVNDLSHLAGGTGLTGMRGEVVLLERLLGQLRQALDAMARLGIAERHVQLEQERAQMVTSAFLAAIAVVQLLPVDRDLVVRTFLEGLGQPPAIEGGAA